MNLSELFSGIVYKRLSATDISANRSTQMAVMGTTSQWPVRQVLNRTLGEATTDGTDQSRENRADRSRRPLTVVYLDDGVDPVVASSQYTWCLTTTLKGPKEPRLGYTETALAALQHAFAGDDGYICVRRGRDSSAREVMLLIARRNSGVSGRLHGALLDRLGSGSWVAGDDADREVGPAERRVLESAGVDLPRADPGDWILEFVKNGLPGTREFSERTRLACPVSVDPIRDPDLALMEWYDWEYACFRYVETELVQARLRDGFGDGISAVDDFVWFAKSFLNVRKSRAGLGFQNHVQAVLEHNALRHERDAWGKGLARPDFLFPGVSQYRDPDWPDDRLAVLGAKTTLKERWRQVLAEADRVRVKHLITMETSISADQMSGMMERGIRIVMPDGIRQLYADDLGHQMLSLADFIGEVKQIQDTDG